MKMNPFHILPLSPWPLLTSMNINSLMLMIMMWMKKKTLTMMIPLSITMLITSKWMTDIKNENSLLGEHTNKSMKTFKEGMILFILSEVALFSSMFWGYFHMSLAPTVEMANFWPPKTLHPSNPYLLPLYGTAILLSSGIFITKAHHTMGKNIAKTKKNTLITIFLGILFLDMQMSEYSNNNSMMMNFNDSAFSSSFFIVTALHGSHVLIGVLMLTTSLKFMTNMSTSKKSFNSFELSAWYWHFVDLVWGFVFTMIYWNNFYS